MCLINLKEQIYPGANGSKDWPTWTLPVLRWTRAQGGIGGYAHSGSGLQIDPEAATGRLLEQLDSDRNGRLDSSEAARGLLPERFAEVDTDRDGTIGATELKASHDRLGASVAPMVVAIGMNSHRMALAGDRARPH